MSTTNLDDKAKTHDERIALLAIAEQFRSLSGFVKCLADSTNRSVGVYGSVVKNALPEAFAALAELQAQFGDVNGGDQPRFSNEQMAETAKAAGGVLVMPAPKPEDEIVITPTRDGFYRVRFPQKPNDSAIRGFHGIVTATGLKMKWDKSGEGDVYWTIPPGMAIRARRQCLEEAFDMIRYWYSEAGKDGKNRNGGKVVAVRVEEANEN